MSNKKAKKENEFITTLNFSSNEVHSAEELVLAPFHLTIENGYILSGQARGLAVEAQNKKYIIVFNQSSTVEKHTVKIKRPTGLEDALVYGIGLVITE